MRGKFVLDAGALHRLLGLTDDARVVFAYAEPDPVAVHVMVEGSVLPDPVEGLDRLRHWMSDGELPVLPHPINNPSTTVDWNTSAVAA